MSSYHFSMSIVKRSAGQSAIAAAAYRAGQRLSDERSGVVHDYANRRGVAHAEIVLPEGAPDWMRDRQRLWNHSESMEKRRDAQLAREINMALPAELTAEARLELVRTFVREQFVAKGMAVDFALHDPVAEKGDDPRNFHAHIMLTLRQVGADGLRSVKTREWNSDEMLKVCRLAWADHQNRALERAGRHERVDARRLDVQRQDAERSGDRAAAAALDRTPEIHMGRRARNIERRGHHPVSQRREERTARPAQGQFRSAKECRGRSREVSYERIDRGTRTRWNAEILEQNERRARARMDKLERQAVRLRQRHMRSLRVSSQPIRQALGADRQQRIAKRHSEASWALLQLVERLIADLLHVRTHRQKRHRRLLQMRQKGRGGTDRNRVF
ncbi:MobQ family relaxase [Agrobacterium cavarae]|uniref:MobQ family relaxase n=1 Tax=Agrobacterium cavarae TaxID=2528239 RepID=UPI002FDAD578